MCREITQHTHEQNNRRDIHTCFSNRTPSDGARETLREKRISALVEHRPDLTDFVQHEQNFRCRRESKDCNFYAGPV